MVTLHTSAQTTDNGKRGRVSQPAPILIGALVALALLATIGAILFQRLASAPVAAGVTEPFVGSEWQFQEQNTLLPEIGVSEQSPGGEDRTWQFRERNESLPAAPVAPDSRPADWRFSEQNTVLPAVSQEGGEATDGQRGDEEKRAGPR